MTGFPTTINFGAPVVVFQANIAAFSPGAFQTNFAGVNNAVGSPFAHQSNAFAAHR